MHILIAGATGLIGKALCGHFLDTGYAITALTRDSGKAQNTLGSSVTCIDWKPGQDDSWAEKCDSVDVVINLAGAPVAEGRWTPAVRKRIRDSRIDATRSIISAVNSGKITPKNVLNASAIGYYGFDPEREYIESDGSGDGFLAEVCREWEAEARKLTAAGVDLTILRIGVVFSAGGGALTKMLLPFRLGLGGILGSGKQWVSWIHIDDITAAIDYIIHNDSPGTVNLVSPESVRNSELTRELASVLRRPAFFPVPSFVLRALFGEMSDILLKSQKIIPKSLLDSGFTFTYPGLKTALDHLLR